MANFLKSGTTLERSEIENKLKESEYLLKESQRIARLGSYLYDVKSGNWTCSDVLDDLFGITDSYRKDFGGWIRIIHPDDQKKMKDYLTEEVLTERQFFNQEYRIIRIDNHEERWVHWLGELKTDASGLLIFLVGTIQDITERKQTEEALRESEEKLRNLTDSTNDLIFRISKNQVLDYISPTIEKLYGYKPTEIEGKKINNLSAIIELPKTLEGFTSLLAGNSLRNFEINFTDRHNKIFPMEINADPIYKDEKIVAVQGIMRDISDRKKAENQVLKERNLAQRYLDIAGVLLTVLDKKGNIVLINKKGCEILEYNESEIINKNWFDLCVEEKNKNELQTVFNSIISNPEKSFEHFENDIITKSGKQKTISFNNTIITDSESNITGILSSGEDVTEKKQAKEELQNIFDNSLDMVGIVDLKNYSFKKINPAFTKILGYEKEEILGKPFFTFIHPQDLERTRDMIENHLKKGEKITDFENRYIAKDGTFKWLAWVSNPIIDKGLSYEIAHDITTRKTAEQALKESEERFKFAFKDSNITVSNQDTRLRYTWIYNPISIYKKERIIGRTDEELFSEEDASVITQLKKDVLSSGNSITKIVRFSDNNSFRYCQITIEPLLSVKNKIIGISSTLTDITDLENTKLKAQESDQLKSAFLANLSHEIRTPMNAILGFSEILTDEDSSDEKKLQYSELINKSSKQLLHIINDIVDISKIEAGQIDLHKDKINLNNKLNEVYTIYKPLTANKGITLKTVLPLKEEESVVYMDSTKFLQIINNLVSNAVKFTSTGEIEFGYKIIGANIEFYVKDTGLGIKPEYQNKIFERFRQADIEWNEKYGGTGLGLSISKAYIELMGGKIWVESEFGVGSTFYFTIPYNPVKNSEPSESPIKNKVNVIDLTGKTILVAEDNDLNFFLLKELLSKTNATLIHGKDGLDAVEKFQSAEHIDIILMDIKMPNMNGYEAITKIRSIDSEIPIIAQSAFAMSDETTKVLETGATDFINKPIKRNVLYQIIAKYLNLKYDI